MGKQPEGDEMVASKRVLYPMNGKKTGDGQGLDSLKARHVDGFAEHELACNHSAVEEDMQVTQKPGLMRRLR